MDPENPSSSDTVPSNAASTDTASSSIDPAVAAQHLSPEPVRQARASITALASLFEDPLTLKPRVRPETVADGMAVGEMAVGEMAVGEMAVGEMAVGEMAAGGRVASQLAVEEVTASWRGDSTDSLANALLTTRPGRSGIEVSEKPNLTVIAPTDTDPTPDPSAESPTDPTALATETGSPPPSVAQHQQVQIKRHEHHLGLVFPPEQTAANPDIMVDFVDSELWQQLQQRLSGGERFWEPGTSVHLNAQNHLLDSRQLQELGEALDRYDLKLTRIATSRRQTAVAAATAGFSIDQGSELPQLLTLSEDKTTEGKTLTAEPLYLQTTVRSGAEVRHPGSVIIMGDLNPGSSVVADGDILIWGRLRGVAHAGAAGNKGSIILALKLEPTQLRIADALARVPQTAQGPTRPEVAYVTAKGDIRITEAAGFTRPYR